MFLTHFGRDLLRRQVCLAATQPRTSSCVLAEQPRPSPHCPYRRPDLPYVHCRIDYLRPEAAIGTSLPGEGDGVPESVRIPRAEPIGVEI